MDPVHGGGPCFVLSHIFWLSPLDGFQFIFLLLFHDSENDLLVN